jgi:DNA-binding transcriptional MerR regulator
MTDSVCIARHCLAQRTSQYFCAEHQAQFYGAETGSPSGMVSGPQAARAAGISYRQLDLWDRIGLVRADIPGRGSGSRRSYSQARVEDLKVLKALVRLGMSTRAVSAFGSAGRQTLLDTLTAAVAAAHEADEQAWLEARA